jgi:hypothetical protein
VPKNVWRNGRHNQTDPLPATHTLWCDYRKAGAAFG